MTAHEIKIRVVIEKNEKQTLQQLVKRLEKFMKDEEKRLGFKSIDVVSRV
jgi:Rad3-related DNA helicase